MAEEVKKSAIAEREEKILAFWQEKQIFKKSVEREAHNDFVFYDGPPFATGLPHFGHILPTAIKDTIPRYQTMKGNRVVRRFGWDCHGLPVENLIEKELGLKTRKDIETMGVGRFNEAARDSVLRYASDWRSIITRLGRFVDMDDDYRTMDATYTETIWWIFKELYNKKLAYTDFKSMHLCPHCETTLSNFEVNQGYKDITDISVYVKFELRDDPGTYLVAWTTTPWTLPGNVALAVNPTMLYSKVTHLELKNKDKTVSAASSSKEQYIIAKDRLDAVLKDYTYSLVEEIPGARLVDKSYLPVFPYYNNQSLKNHKNGFKVYEADFVTAVDGAGIVHIAPAFGEDDMKLGREKELPFIQHVGTDGAFKKEVIDFVGLQVKPKDDHQRTDIEIIKYLAHNGVLFGKEKIIHSYPHCWRCDTPLLNYAASSWFIKVTDLKEKLVKENKKVTWVPAEIGEGRFGNWLAGARDWAISRTRYWGAPLPVWKCESCEALEVLGSVADIRTKTRANNTYLIMRHGEAESNVLGNGVGIASTKVSHQHHLTEKGRAQIETVSATLADAHIDLIVASPFLRTQESAHLVAEKLGLLPKQILTDARLGEINAGVFDLRPWDDYRAFFAPYESSFTIAPPGGESREQVRQRMLAVLYDIESQYKGKTILFVTHGTPAWTLFAGIFGWSTKEAVAEKDNFYLKNAEVRPLPFVPLPHNEKYELDFHRPFIDEIYWKCPCGGTSKRIPDVFDCWFESGAMPYAEAHYPFEKDSPFDPRSGWFKKAKGFPADFIGEGLDQTRGWFYSMLVLGVALFGKTPYKNVVVNGLILAEDGQKMSKKLKNYPDLMGTVNKYGADAIRFYLISSPGVHAEDVAFSEKGVDEVMKKMVMRFDNVVGFYEMYKGQQRTDSYQSETKLDVLDQWIRARLTETTLQVTKALDAYELDRACRPLEIFVDDLSTWYLRRSRERVKSEDIAVRDEALSAIRSVVHDFSIILAPFMPFLAEDIFQRVKNSDDVESVHLVFWPKVHTLNADESNVLTAMHAVREIVSLGLEARSSAGIKVRQPLASLTVSETSVVENPAYAVLIADEVNVKEVRPDEKQERPVLLDTVITPALKEEGQMRELVRALQEARKNAKLQPQDRVLLMLDTDQAGKVLVKKFEKEIARIAGIREIQFEKIEGVKIEADGVKFGIKVVR